MKFCGEKSRSVAGGLRQRFRADEQHKLSAAKPDMAPVVDRKVEHCKTRCRQVVGERLASFGIAAGGEGNRPLRARPTASSCIPGLCPTTISRCGSIVDAARTICRSCDGSAP